MLRVTLNWRENTGGAGERLRRMIEGENFYNRCFFTWTAEHPEGWRVQEGISMRTLIATDEAICFWMRLNAPSWARIEED